jgi:hypothetical protein
VTDSAGGRTVLLGPGPLTGDHLVTIDATDPAQPAVLGRLFGFPRKRIVVMPDVTVALRAESPCAGGGRTFAGDLAVATRFAEMSEVAFFNVTDPAAPCELGHKVLTASPTLNPPNPMDPILESFRVVISLGFARGLAVLPHADGVAAVAAVEHVGLISANVGANSPAVNLYAEGFREGLLPGDVVDVARHRAGLVALDRGARVVAVLTPSFGVVGWVTLPEAPSRLAVVEAMAGDVGTELSKGGMKTKILAAKTAVSGGCALAITEGSVARPLSALAAGAPCTWFLAPSDPVTARKRWIAGNLEPRGAVEIDAGAEKALASGKSLLPAGVRRVEGDFERGDAVIIRNADGREIGRGLIAYGASEAKQILGKKSSEIAVILGHAGRAELIHRDDMALAPA